MSPQTHTIKKSRSAVPSHPIPSNSLGCRRHRVSSLFTISHHSRTVITYYYVCVEQKNKYIKESVFETKLIMYYSDTWLNTNVKYTNKHLKIKNVAPEISVVALEQLI